MTIQPHAVRAIAIALMLGSAAAVTIQPAGRGEQTHTTEQWTFMRANCTSKTAN